MFISCFMIAKLSKNDFRRLHFLHTFVVVLGFIVLIMVIVYSTKFSFSRENDFIVSELDYLEKDKNQFCLKK